MALIDIGHSYPDHIKGSRGIEEEQRISTYDRWLKWKPWRNLAVNTPDGYPHALAFPYDDKEMIVDVRGCNGVLVSVVTEDLTAAGKLTGITDWAGELWILGGPPEEAQWTPLAGTATGSMADAPFSKIIELFPLWYVAWRISTNSGTGILKVSLRPV